MPGTVNNFVTLARYGYYDDTLIFRTDPSIGILQGGGQNNTQSPGYDDPRRGHRVHVPPGPAGDGPHRRSRTRPAGSGSSPSTDAAAALDAQGTYVVFGEVTEGLDIAEADARPGAGQRRHADRDDHASSGSRSPSPDDGAHAAGQLAVHGRVADQLPARRRAHAAPHPVGSSTTGVSASDSVRLRRSALHDSASGTIDDAADEARARA